MLAKLPVPRPRGKRWLERRRKEKFRKLNLDTILSNLQEVCPCGIYFEETSIVANPRKHYKEGVDISR